MIYGYVRVSTDNQDPAVRRGQPEAAGCARVFSDTLDGMTTDRPQPKRLMKAPAPGALVVTPTADRLARSPTRQEALHRKADGETIRAIAQGCKVRHSTTSRLHGPPGLTMG